MPTFAFHRSAKRQIKKVRHVLIRYVVSRILWSIPIFFMVSLLAFLIIQAPPGDFVTAHAAASLADGQEINIE